jgi:hypothetical protein
MIQTFSLIQAQMTRVISVEQSAKQTSSITMKKRNEFPSSLWSFETRTITIEFNNRIRDLDLGRHYCTIK